MRYAVLLLICAALLSGSGNAAWLPSVPSNFRVEPAADVPGARAIAITPDGTLIAGTRSGDVYAVSDVENTKPASARVVAHFDDPPASGVAYANSTVYIGTQNAVWALSYAHGKFGKPHKLTSVRQGSPPSGSDGDVHTTTSVAASGKHVYASVGSSCNACVETDPSRATIGSVENGRYTVMAKRVRNAIALTVNDATGSLWAGVSGEDDLPAGHPYEFFDDVSAYRGVADYGWPFCYENRRSNPVPAWAGKSCAGTAVPRVVFPAYETPTAAVFYPQHGRGKYAFPATYAGGAFVALHGSWHGPAQGLSGYLPPRVVFVPMHGDSPVHAVNWSDPSAQWVEFASGYQQGGSAHRNGRPAGLAVGPQGDLFIADDMNAKIYRVRPH